MKKILAIITLGSLLGASHLKATQIDIYLTGSTAFQKQAYHATTNLFGAGYKEVNSSGAGADGGAVWAIYGTMSSVFGASQPVVIHATWTGSVQGLYGLLGNLTSDFTNVNSSGVGSDAGSHLPSACFSDVDSIATPYYLNPSSYKEDHVAVQPFIFCKSPGMPASVTNVTEAMLLALSQSSKTTLNIFTGVSTDTNTPVFLVNRNTDSGTRVTVFADLQTTGPGSANYYPTNVSPYWYYSTNNLGNAIFGPGYTSGGNLATAVNNSSTAAAIGYMGVGNGNAVNGGKNVLNYNGYPFSSDYSTSTGYGSSPVYSFDNVINGKYTYWAYECLDYPTTTVPADNANLTAAQLSTFCHALGGYNSMGVFVSGPGSIDYDITNNATTLTLAVSLNSMHVQRSAVGGPLSFK